jgi:hypothetical protein
MTKPLAVLASLLALATTASANALVVASDPAAAPTPVVASVAASVAESAPTPSSPPAPRLLDARIGTLLGSAQVGDIQNFSPGISGGIGYRIGDTTIRLLGDYYRVGDEPGGPMARRGRASRIGAAARYSFAHTDPDNQIEADFWGELGGGYEHVAWLAGGVLDRPSAELAVGIDAGKRSAKDRGGGHHVIGYFMAFRTHVGVAPEMPGAVATCGGPCTAATTPPRTDVSMFFELGVHWGH